MAVYRSKINRGIMIFLLLLFGSSFITAAYTGNPAGLPILIPVVLFIVHIYFNTNYTISESTLTVRCGFFRWHINIMDITKAADTKSVLSAPALSLDRLALFYGGYTVISPKDKTGFISHLQKINPAIQYVPKVKI